MSWGIQATGTKTGVIDELEKLNVGEQHEEEKAFVLSQLQRVPDTKDVFLIAQGSVYEGWYNLRIELNPLTRFVGDP